MPEEFIIDDVLSATPAPARSASHTVKVTDAQKKMIMAVVDLHGEEKAAEFVRRGIEYAMRRVLEREPLKEPGPSVAPAR